MTEKMTPGKAVLDSTLTAIAQEHLGLETLETRNSDSLDFHDLSVASIRQALAAAFAAGAAQTAAGLPHIAELLTAAKNGTLR